MMMAHKIVYNACYGGFGLSEKAIELGQKLAPELDWLDEYSLPRHHPALVKVVEELGKDANGDCAKLVIEEIESYEYRIDEYDGAESVNTKDSYHWVSVFDMEQTNDR